MIKRFLVLLLIVWAGSPLLLAEPNTLEGKCFSNPSAGVEYRVCPSNCVFVNDPRFLSQALEAGADLIKMSEQHRSSMGRLGLQFYVFVRPPQGQRPTANFNLLTEDLPPSVTTTAQYGQLALPMTRQAVAGFKQLASPKERNIGGKMFEGMEFEGLIQGQALRFRSYYCVDTTRKVAYVVTLTDGAATASKTFPILEAALGGIQLGIAGGQG